MASSSDPISKLNGALEGRYAIERELGEGGMATVYLAQDLRHEREVALKVLKPDLSAVIGAERFLAEIKTTANLQHPHILPLFDSGEADGFLFFVMPYVEGDTLRDKIDREKQLSIEQALEIAKKVASALDYAHEHGVVHRDIKPGNILLSERGEPTVADFGIALAVAQAGGGRVTETGLSVGTPHYMSPEQATGDRDVDPRTDVYALGCVLYEMLTGDPPYQGSTAQAVLAKILTDPAPTPNKVRVAVPPNVDAAIRKALEKLPADRFGSAQEFSHALGDAGFRHGEEPLAGVVKPLGPWRRVSTALGLLVLVLICALGWSLLQVESTPSDPVVVRADLTDFEVSSGGGNRFDISRDGSMIVTVSETRGPGLFIRDTDDMEFREIPGTEGAFHPTFSPDGEWLAFEQQSENEIYRVQLSGGPVLPVASGDQPHWGVQESIVFVRRDGVYFVSAAGGEPTLLLGGDSLQWGYPFLLPDGDGVVFQEGATAETRRLMLVEIGSGVVTDLGVTGNDPQYVRTGHLLYGHADQALMAVPFDLGSHRVTGEPFTALPGVQVRGGGPTQFKVSETGTALYGLPGAFAGRQIVEMTLDGVETPLPFAEAGLARPRYSPEGGQIAYESGQEVWVYDRETGANDQLSDGLGQFPTWSSDGRYVHFSVSRGSAFDVYRRLSDLSEEQELIHRSEWIVYPNSALASGNQLLMTERVNQAGRGLDLTIMSESQDGADFTEYLRADWDEYAGAVSPDQGWVAYTSTQSGQPEVYVRSLSGAANQIRVSVNGGDEAVWSPDGTALYYRSALGVMRAEVLRGDPFGAATPQAVIEGAWLPSSVGRFPSNHWDIHPDGDRFVLVRGAGALAANARGGLPIRIVVNWFEELRQRMGYQ